MASIFPDKFMPFMNQPRRITLHSVNAAVGRRYKCLRRSDTTPFIQPIPAQVISSEDSRRANGEFTLRQTGYRIKLVSAVVGRSSSRTS